MPKKQAVSWMDRFFKWVERLPIHFLLFYLLWYFAIVTVYHLILWSSRLLEVGQLSPGILLTIPFWGILQVAAFHYFQNQAEEAIEAFKPVLGISSSEFEKVRFGFVHFSGNWIIFLSVFAYFAGVFFLLGPYNLIAEEFKATTGTSIVTLLLMFVAPLAFGFFIFVFRSLVWINRLYKKIPKINLFNQQPLYALSRFTSKVGILFILYMVLNFLTATAWNPDASSAIASFYLFLNGIIALLAFVLPLWGVHIRLAKEKETSFAENNLLIEKHFQGIQQNVRAGKNSKLTALREANAALLEYRQELAKISTWPWDTATLRTFVTALAVPMIVWFVQQVLQRTLIR